MIMMMKDEIDNSTSYHDDFQTIFEVSNIKYKDEPGQSPLWILNFWTLPYLDWQSMNTWKRNEE